MLTLNLVDFKQEICYSTYGQVQYPMRPLMSSKVVGRSRFVISVGVTKGAAIDRILGEIVHSKSMITPIDYVLCVGHFLAKDEDIYTFFEPELPSEPLNAAKAKASDGCRPSLDRRTSGRSSNSRNNSRSSQSRTQRSQSGSERRNSFNHNSQRSPQETMSWRENSPVLDLKGENYFSCAVGKKDKTCDS